MRVTLFMIFLLSVAACARYTEATSPCLSRDGQPAVSRNATTLPTISAQSSTPAKGCDFEPVNTG